MEGSENGASVLGSGSPSRFFLLWCRMCLNGLARPMVWAVTLYITLCLVSNFAFAASTYFDYGWRMHSADPGQAACSAAEAAGFSPCNSYCVSSSYTAQFPSNVPPGGYISTSGYRCNNSGSISADCTYGNGNWCQVGGFAVTAPSCPVDQTAVDVGGGVYECQEDPDPCENATDDDYMENYEVTGNPGGLCSLGDTLERSYSQCGYSNAAGGYCNASVTENFEIVEMFPMTTDYAIDVTFSSTGCEGPEDPPVIIPEECEEPPPTCPEGFNLEDVTGMGTWTCVDTNPSPTPPPAVTGLPNTTTTTTTTTTENPDGSVTTVSETETEFGECPEGQNCTAGNPYAGPEEDWLDSKTFRESNTAFWNSINAAPLVSSVGGIGSAIPESTSCPTFDLDLAGTWIGENYAVTGHCDIISPYEGQMRTVFLIAWSLLGVFIILSA